MDTPWLDLLFRWSHFAFALIWIGHNYANLVQNPRFRPFDPGTSEDACNHAVEQRMQREHGTFRYASIVVWLSGIGMLWQRGWLADALLLRGDLAVIGMGAWIGTLMLLNLWLIMWPHQKKVLGFVPAPLEERVRCSRITFLASRSNTILSMPLLFFMAAGSHGLALFH
ncbi:urate hydroxylase PuuD [Marinobacterium sp. D7]|uniref:urate hydroxylase PuuD n=1 Tax=Marinobacterium ramblicola TaxID=2849041 RepID=UPI001C2DEBEB|nr:urate hydroxylase PuuD [Marinobacterium ramblicola]MBV1787525.1 urate hydroxylase PuuD [Marinobacterium ramblicola]